MAVSRKPKREGVDEFIQAGGSDSAKVTSAKQKSEKNKPKTAEQDIQPVKLRIDRELLDQIDAAVAGRKPTISRHQWILEACYEKLDRDIRKSS